MHEREIEVKLRKHEENRGLNDKKAYEDQFTNFCQLYLGTLLYSLSLSHSLLHTQINIGALLEHAWSTLVSLDLEKEGKGKQESARGQWDQQLQLDFFAGTELHV